MKNKKRILIVSEYHLVVTFIENTFKRLKSEKNIQVDCFIISRLSQDQVEYLYKTFDNVYFINQNEKYVEKIPKIRFFPLMFNLRKISRNLPFYDFIHINFLHYYLVFISKILRKKCSKFYITFFGSDFNDIEWYRSLASLVVVKLTDGIFATNPTFLEKIENKYDLDNKKIQKDILFPVMVSFEKFESYLQENNNETAKKKIGTLKPIIVGGYNATPIVRHKNIIDSLIFVEDKIRNFKVIFPMTYGRQANQTRLLVKNLLSSTNLDYLIFDKYLSTEKLMALRLATDIFIHIQSRDQMAASMLEHLAAGSIVITGKWLPYENLEQLGIYFLRIEKVADLTSTLISVLDNIEYHREKSKINKDLILNMMRWDQIKLNWFKYYDLDKY